MANYNIIANTSFKARSFDEMLKPLAMYTQEYNAQQEALSQLETEASVWEKLANENGGNSKAYKQYRNYADSLRQQADALAKNGLTPGSRKALYDLKGRYAKEINPIQEAYNWKVQQIQNEAEGRNKGVVYDGDASMTSIDDYLSNPTLIHRSADSTTGYNRVANAAQSIAKGLSDARFTGNLDKYTKALLTKAGYDVSDVAGSVNLALRDLEGVLNGKIPMNSPAGIIVNELLNNEANASGVSSWGDTQSRQEYLNKVAPALYNLIGDSKVSPVEDVETRSQLQLRNSIASANHSAALSKQNALFQQNMAMAPYGLKYVMDDEGNITLRNADGSPASQEAMSTWITANSRRKTDGSSSSSSGSGFGSEEPKSNWGHGSRTVGPDGVKNLSVTSDANLGAALDVTIDDKGNRVVSRNGSIMFTIKRASDGTISVMPNTENSDMRRVNSENLSGIAAEMSHDWGAEGQYTYRLVGTGRDFSINIIENDRKNLVPGSSNYDAIMQSLDALKKFNELVYGQ